jgi:hypothetical protein
MIVASRPSHKNRLLRWIVDVLPRITSVRWAAVVPANGKQDAGSHSRAAGLQMQRSAL